MTMADRRVALDYHFHSLLDQLRRTIFRWKLRPARLIADTTYGTLENIRALCDTR